MTIHHLDEVIEAREIREAAAERLRKAAERAVPAAGPSGAPPVTRESAARRRT